MTPQEQDLITQLLERLKRTDVQGKDLEAEALIRAGVAAQPDVPYLLVQTVLIQNMTLDAAQARITELEQQLAAAQQAAAKPTSFLGGRTGSVPASPSAVSPAAAPSPWGSRQAAVAPPAQPWGAPPGGPGGMGQGIGQGMGMGGGGGFLRNAAATAAGVAGGALLFQGISSLLGGHNAGLGGTPAAGLAGIPADSSRDNLLEQQGLAPSDSRLADNQQAEDQTPDQWDTADAGGQDNGGFDDGGGFDGGGFDDSSDV
jgi:uncharacterized protein